MENKKQVGGKRRGAGRKPVLSKKKQVSIYVEGSKILRFGNEEKYKEFLHQKTNEHCDDNLNTEIKYAPVSDTSFDAKKVDMVKADEVGQWQELKPQQTFKTVAQWVAEKRELESEEEFHKWEAKLDADTILTDKQKKAIKIS